MFTHYDKDFYKDQEHGSYVSAKELLPVLFKYIQPESVIDIGCGLGTWLKAFKEDYKIDDILGIDGNYVKKEQLYIPQENFMSYDLTKTYTPTRKYDLAISLEVGEHLPDSSAGNLVRSLTNASDVIMFSAAIPRQKGTYHINEQYPEYWAEKFIAEGYIPIDLLRKQIWNNRKIELWYRQNVLLYIKKSVYEEKYKLALQSFAEKTDPDFLVRIHPEVVEFYDEKMEQINTVTGYLRHRLYFLKKIFKK